MIEHKNNLKIKELVIGVPKHSIVPFDPDRYISNREWAMLDRRVEGSASERFLWVGFLFDAKLLAPWVSLHPDKWEMMKKDMDKFKREHPDTPPILHAAVAKLYFPDRYQELGIDDERWDEYFRDTEDMKYLHGESMDSIKVLTRTIAIAILAPQRKEELTQSNKLRSWFYSRVQRDDSYLLPNVAAVAKLIFPDDLEESGILNTDSWQYMKEQLDEKRNVKPVTVGSSMEYFVHAGYMAVLSAKEVAITDQGVQLYFDDPDKLNKPKLNLPRVKKF